MIEKKLRTLLEDQEGSIKHCCGQLGTDDVEWDIVQIKQAFKDEGYLKHPQSVQESRDPLLWDRDRLLTGQEWYDRFVENLDSVNAVGELNKTSTLNGVVRLAARKAAGL